MSARTAWLTADDAGLANRDGSVPIGAPVPADVGSAVTLSAAATMGNELSPAHAAYGSPDPEGARGRGGCIDVRPSGTDRSVERTPETLPPTVGDAERMARVAGTAAAIDLAGA